MTKQYIAAAVVELAATRLERLEHVRTNMLASIQAEREQIQELNSGVELDADMLADECRYLD